MDEGKKATFGESIGHTHLTLSHILLVIRLVIGGIGVKSLC